MPTVPAHPTAAWAAQQIREALPEDGADPRYFLRDRDGVYGDVFQRVVRAIGIRETLTAPQSPWQNPYAERVIGSIRRECLDHLMILNDDRLRKILKEHVCYYNESRPHLSPERNAPIPRDVEPSAQGGRRCRTAWSAACIICTPEQRDPALRNAHGWCRFARRRSRLLSGCSTPGGVTPEPILLVSTLSATGCVVERVCFCIIFDPDGLFGRDR